MNKFETMTQELEEYFIKRNISSAVKHFEIQLKAITLCYKEQFYNQH